MRPHLKPADRETLFAATRRIADHNDGRLPSGHIRQLAQQFGVSTRTVRRVHERGEPRDRVDPGCNPGALSVEQKVAIANNVSLKAAWNDLHEAGLVDVGYRAFCDRFKRLPQLEQVGLTQGAKEAAAYGLSVAQVIDNRNAVWHFDHTELDIDVTYRNKTARPWMSALVDSHSRFVLAVLIIFGGDGLTRPNGDTVVALLVQAMLGFVGPDDNTYGGMPSVVMFDNALEHLTESVESGFGMHGVIGRPIPPGSPWRQGKVERFMRTINEEFCAKQPGYVHGKQDRYGRNPGREHPLHLDEFKLRLDEFVEYYNFEREHQGISRLTPADAWNLDDTPVQLGDHTELRRAFMQYAKSREVRKEGVMIDGAYFTHQALARYRGSKVEVRTMASSRAFVDCYSLKGDFICSAVPRNELTANDVAAIANYKERNARNVAVWLKRDELERRQAAERAAVEASFDTDEDDDGNDGVPIGPAVPSGPDDDGYDDATLEYLAELEEGAS